MSFSSPPERPSISRSVSPVSTVSRSHSGYRNDAQDGYHRVPYVPQRDREIEMTEQHHSTPAERHATNPNVLGTDRSLPALPNKYNTVIHATDVESETHHPIFRSDDALLSRTEKLRDIIGKFWLWEILAYCFSLACMGAVIGVLLYEDGKRLDRWGLKISPNAVISFIVTLAKSSFLLAITEIISQLKWLHYHDKSHKLSHLKLFDEASRGPFGSLKLLIAGHKVTLLASCAAGIMLAALFVDPFVQLVLSFPSRGTLATTESASFQTAQLYDPNQYLLDGHDTAATAGSVSTSMQAAILEGLYNGTGQPLLSCPTGNCTWTDLTTLGVCGSCDDITPQIKTNCPGRTLENNGQYECDYALPLNQTLKGYIHSYGGSGIFSQTRWNSSAADLGILGSDTPPGSPALLEVFEAIQLQASETDGLPPPKGSRCTLFFCKKTYAEANVTNGIPSMSVPEEDGLLLDHSSNRSICPTCGIEIFQDMIRNSSATGGTNQSKFSVNIADYANIQAYLQEMFSTGWDDIGGSTRALSNDGTPVTPTAPDVGRELANAQDLNQTIGAIADSMTEYIRTSPNSTSQVGKSYIEKTFIEVRWGWLAFPIALIFLTLILLVAVIVETQRRGAVAWKSSALAMLFYKLDGWEIPERGIVNTQELDRIASQMRGRLLDGGDHPAFIKED